VSKLARAELQARLRTAYRLDRQGDAEDEAPPPTAHAAHGCLICQDGLKDGLIALPTGGWACEIHYSPSPAGPPCPHAHLVTCEGPGVACEACDALLAWCGAGAHVSERMWNRACANDKETPADQDRETHCAICGDKIAKEPT
jgi:hypothetical protein